MIKQLDELTRVQEELEEYFEAPGFANRYIEQNPDSFFEIREDYLLWADDSEVSEFSAKIENIIRKEEIVAVLIESDFGDDDYWNVFYVKNEIEFED